MKGNHHAWAIVLTLVALITAFTFWWLEREAQREIAYLDCLLAGGEHAECKQPQSISHYITERMAE